MKKILVFGLNGFIGKNLKKYLKNYKVYAIENKNKIKKTKNIFPLKNNIDYDKIESIKYFNNLNIDYIINLSWYGIPKFNKTNNKKNLIFQKKLINFFSQINVKKIFFSGSCYEYDQSQILVNENSNVTKKNPLGVTKLKIKKYAEKKLKSKLIWGRIFFVFGHHQRSNSLLPYVKRNLNKKKFAIKYPFNFNDFINVNKVCEIIIFLLDKNAKGTFNICHGRPRFNLEFLEDQLKKRNFTNIKNQKVIDGFYGSNKKLKQLGFKF